MTTLAALAPVLQTTVGHLLEGSELRIFTDGVSGARRPHSIPVVGKLAAGVFREVVEHDDGDVEYIFDEPDPEYPHAKQIAFTVEGEVHPANEPAAGSTRSRPARSSSRARSSVRPASPSPGWSSAATSR